MYKDILLAVDHDSDDSWRRALPVDLEHCKAFGSTLHVITVVQELGVGNVSSFLPLDFEKKAVERVRKWLEEWVSANVPAGVKTQRMVAVGKVYAEILAAAVEIDADLIVLASHNPELSDFLIGSNAAKVARHADRSVLIVRTKAAR